jgi:hypothetical protein
MPNAPLINFHGEHAKVPLPLRVLGRYFLTGRALRGPGDNATMFHRATVDYRARPYITLSAPKWQRLARRNGAITVPVMYGAWVTAQGAAELLGMDLPGPQPALWVLVAYVMLLVFGSLAWASWAFHRSLKGRTVNKRYIDPAARTLYAMTGARYDKRAARQMISLSPDWEPGGPVIITLPTDTPLTSAKERQLVKAVGGRLGVVDAKGSWTHTGPRVKVEIVGTPLPPTVVTLDMLREAVAAAPLERPVVGWGTDGPESIDYVQDSPHVALSGAAGTGKTTLLRFLLAQRMAHGVGVIFLDAKRWSHRWAHHLPEERSQYWYRVPDMHKALLALGEELDRRINCDEGELGTFRTIDVVVEEINSLIKMLTAYWKGERKRIMNEAKLLKAEDMDYDEADLDPPTLSPAVAALQFAVNMGRELQIHVHVAAQRLEANVFGSNSGAAVRQSFQIRLMAQWDKALWNMLAGGHDYVAWPSGPRGLWGFVQGTQFKIIRVPDMSMAEAVQLATSGTVDTAIFGQQAMAKPRMDTGQDRPAIGSAVTLAMALDSLPGQDGPRALSLDGLRTAARRPGFPAPLAKPDGQPYGRTEAKLYDLDSLLAWRMDVLELVE